MCVTSKTLNNVYSTRNLPEKFVAWINEHPKLRDVLKSTNPKSHHGNPDKAKTLIKLKNNQITSVSSNI